MNTPLSQKPRRRRSINSILPSLLTLASFCAGLTAVRNAIDGHTDLALMFILAATILDGLDGTVARWLKATSHFGGELDSLADFVAFGVSPALIVYFTLFDATALEGLYWGVSLVFTACCGLRLARFNVLSLTPESKKKPDPFFRGVPAPGGGLLSLMPLALFQLQPEWGQSAQAPMIYAAWLVFVGLMMVSSIPTVSPKNVRFPSRYNVLFVLLLFVILLVAIEQPWLVWVAACCAYLIAMPVVAVKLKRQQGS